VGIEERLLIVCPRFIAFNGKKAAAAYLKRVKDAVRFGDAE
jgi:hypothetical protein